MHELALSTRPLEHGVLGSDVLALIADSVVCTDEEGRILFFNRAAEEAFGYSADEVVGQPVETLLPCRYRTAHVEKVLGFAVEESSAKRLMGQRREVWGRRKSGEEFSAEAMVSRQRVDGKVVLAVAIRDITQRKELEEQREAIAGELDHRVRNVLSVVNSLVRLTAKDADSVEQFKDILLGRLSALANTQNALRFGAQQSASLNELLSGELQQYRSPDGANIVIEGPHVALGSSSAQSLALASHELATNSAKYGALSVPGGRVTVTFTLRHESNKSLVAIEWREAGGPPVKRPERKGFGTRLIDRIIGGMPGAKVDTEYPPSGVICRILFPCGSAPNSEAC